jgi:hypothetical protein
MIFRVMVCRAGAGSNGRDGSWVDEAGLRSWPSKPSLRPVGFRGHPSRRSYPWLRWAFGAAARNPPSLRSGFALSLSCHSLFGRLRQPNSRPLAGPRGSGARTGRSSVSGARGRLSLANVPNHRDQPLIVVTVLASNPRIEVREVWRVVEVRLPGRVSGKRAAVPKTPVAGPPHGGPSRQRPSRIAPRQRCARPDQFQFLAKRRRRRLERDAIAAARAPAFARRIARQQCRAVCRFGAWWPSRHAISSPDDPRRGSGRTFAGSRRRAAGSAD